MNQRCQIQQGISENIAKPPPKRDMFVESTEEGNCDQKPQHYKICYSPGFCHLVAVHVSVNSIISAYPISPRQYFRRNSKRLSSSSVASKLALSITLCLC